MGNKSRLTISVVMATYNGEKYILQQLNSILSQLSYGDEVIIVDDCSKDNTSSVINSLQDKRIKLVSNVSNLGVKKSFERGLNLATNELIFLSDQDDIWLPNKVTTILQKFAEDYELVMVYGDAVVIDENNRQTNNSFLQIIGGNRVGIINTFIKNTHLGCTMALRKKMLNYILPIPQNIPMHDSWIGILCQIYGKSLYIDEPLMHYRRHSCNASKTTRESLYQVITWRVKLFFALIKQIIIKM